ncbi:hypothetical protein E2562_026108 [Oryza meyeriana var. granulata]|uniref:Uncharacterized protein n=1 Tax=Oryza meyeriana var. granulata TaxID=110450 RepID=A0A6G1C1N8_9ORYZ|nr:hypothetical protein E2562_026108 [Oryza meyeriana var. granulata]
MEESVRMRDRACDTDSYQDGVGSDADVEEEFDREAAPAAAGDGGMAGGDEVEHNDLLSAVDTLSDVASSTVRDALQPNMSAFEADEAAGAAPC